MNSRQIEKTFYGALMVLTLLVSDAAGQPAESHSIESLSGDVADSAETAEPLPAPILPSPPSNPPLTQTRTVQWGSVFKQAFSFLVIEESFRLLTEEGSRHTHLPFWAGYAESVANLHGWADGDPFLVNYVGHPMQGAVSGYIWIQNDLRYRDAEIGKNRQYWKGRLRAAAFAYAYSVAEEIGPISEASIGATQARFPQQGFADHVVTPTIGLAWIIAEDTVDKYVVKKIEQRVTNPYVRLLVRGGLNPSRSLANVLSGNVPWNRYTRPGVMEQASQTRDRASTLAADDAPVTESFPDVAPFEFTTLVTAEQDFGSSGPCIGAGGEAAIRVQRSLQLVVNIGGCKMTGLEANVSGDSLRYLAGPRWTPFASSRWSPFAELLAGGRKVTQEVFFPEKKAALALMLLQKGQKLEDPDHDLYTSSSEQAGFTFKAGVGVDMKLNRALALRIASIDYSMSWAAAPLSGSRRSQGLQLTSGLVLRMGTW
jgi:hypothetical protein